MDSLLDNNKQRKNSIINIIFSAKAHTITFSELQKQTGLSSVTLTKALNEIFRDLDNIHRTGTLITTKQGNQHLYTLTQRNQFIRNELFCMYLQESLKFKLLIDIFEQPNQNIEELAFNYYISVSSMKREYNRLKKILKKFQINLSGYTQIRLTGTETSIRLFYSHLYFEAYQGASWPFKSVEQFPLENCRTILPHSIYSKVDFKHQLFIYYIFAVSATRCIQGIKINNTPSHFPFFNDTTDEDFIQKKNAFMQFFKTSVSTNFSTVDLETEVLFIYSVIFSHKESYDHTHIIPGFFFFTEALNHLNFQIEVTNITNQLLAIFKIDSGTTTYYELLYKVCIIHYRTYLFDDILLHIPLYWTLDELAITEKDVYYTLTYDKLKAEVDFSRTNLSQLHTDYLLKSYSVAIQPIVRSTFMSKKLHILFIASTTDYLFMTRSLGSEFAKTYINFEVVDIMDEQIDVIISDTLIDCTLLQLDSDIPVIYFEAASYLEYLGQIVDDLLLLQLKKNNC